MPLPIVQRMESSRGNLRGVVDSLMKVVGALKAGIELAGEDAQSAGTGRGVRLKEPAAQPDLPGLPEIAGRCGDDEQ